MGERFPIGCRTCHAGLHPRAPRGPALNTTDTDARDALPSEDRTLSPRTGWTRAHWLTLADRTLDAVQPYATPGHALVHLPGPASRSGRLSDGLEGYARTFLAAAFRIAGDPGSSRSARLADWYRSGLVAGTAPGSAEAWPRMRDVPQARVEAASIALALHETRDVIWAVLTDGQREQVVDWFSDVVGAGALYPRNNWLWFQNVVLAFLQNVGGPTSPTEVAANLASVEGWYTGDGWYTDGALDGEHRSYDHYCGWAMHFYPLLWCRMLGDSADPQLVASYRTRLHRWLEQAQHLVGGDGAPLYQGRSLTYRFAVLAPFWIGALCGATPLSPGRTRRLASGVLRHFTERGAWDSDGLLPLGWHGEHAAIRQGYSGPGSPYWASKGFAGLLLPADHPVWTAVEEPLELETRDVALAMPAPGWLVSATRDDGIVRVVNHGGDHWSPEVLGLDDSVYGRLSYTGVTAPDDGLVAETGPVDSSVVLLAADGRPSHRRPLQRLGVDGRVAVSRHRAHWLVGTAQDAWADGTETHRFEVGPWLTVASVLRGAVEVRVVRVDVDDDPARGPADDREGGRAPVLPGPWRLRVGGHCVAGSEPPTRTASPTSGPAHEPVVAEVTGEDGLRARVVGLLGAWQPAVHRTSGANAMGRHAAVPLLVGTEDAGDGTLAAVAVVLTGGHLPAPPLPTVSVRPDARGRAVTVTVAWPDREQDHVRLDPPDALAR